MKVIIAALLPREPAWGAAISYEYLVGLHDLLGMEDNSLVFVRYDRLDVGLRVACETFMEKTLDEALLLLPHTHRLPGWGVQRLSETEGLVVAPVSWDLDNGAPRVYHRDENAMTFMLNEVGSAIAPRFAEADYKPHVGTMLPPFEGHLLKDADAVGAPMLIKREALKRIPHPWFDYSGETPEFSFWESARAQDIRPIVDMGVLCASGGRDARTFLEEYGVKDG